MLSTEDGLLGWSGRTGPDKSLSLNAGKGVPGTSGSLCRHSWPFDGRARGHPVFCRRGRRAGYCGDLDWDEGPSREDLPPIKPFCDGGPVHGYIRSKDTLPADQ